MNPVCVKCRKEMHVKINGVSVSHEATPWHTRSGDLYSCLTCGAEVIIGFSTAFYDENKSDLEVW